LFGWWGLVTLQLPGRAAQVPEAAKPAVINPSGESHTPEGAEQHESAAELAGLQDKLKTLSTAFEAKKQELAPRMREAQSRVQQLTEKLQKAGGPGLSKTLEEELRLAQESLALLERELAVAGEEVTVAEGVAMVAEKRAKQQRVKGQQLHVDGGKTLTAQDARVATEEAKVAADKVTVVQGKVETLQTDLRALEGEAVESQELVSANEREISAITQRLEARPGGDEQAQLEQQLRMAKQRGDVLQKRLALLQRQRDLARSKVDLAQREHELLAADLERLEGHANTIRDTVGVSLDDVKADQEQAVAAQKAAESAKQRAQQQQVAAQQERERAQQALEQARLAKERAKTPEQARLAELLQLVAEKRGELAQKKADLVREKIDLAEKAAALAHKRLEVTAYKLESERKELTATDILNTYEWAKAEAAKASKEARSAQAGAALAKQEADSLRREAELAQLKAQVEKNQLDRPPTDPIVRDTLHALDDSSQVAQNQAQVAEERSTVVQDRARLATEKEQLLRELEEQLAVQRSAYQLWKREPSKITWEAMEEVLTDLRLLRSTLIIGVSTLPEQLSRLGSYLADPTHFWKLLGQSVLVLVLLLLTASSGISLRRKLQPFITRQKSLFLPSTGEKLLRASTRLVAATALPGFLLMAILLRLWLITEGRMFFRAVATALAGYALYSMLKGLIQELFMPWDPQQRLIACRNGIATYLYRHLSRLLVYVMLFSTAIVILKVVHYHEGFIALVHLPFYLGLVMLLMLLTTNKEAILELFPHAENRLERLIYVTATRVYPLFVLLLACILVLQSIGYVNLARFLLTSSALTAVILLAAHFAGKGLDKLLRWWLLAEGREEQDFLLGRETAETVYTILSHTAGYVAYLVAMIMIAGTWGVDLSGIYATLTSTTAQDYYRRLLAAILVIGISTVVLRTAYFVIDKIFNVSPEEARAWRKRIALGDKGRTVAPLLKSVLKYCTIFFAGVLVLRVLGVDPTPIIAGAGVVGLAVGFGAQTLVKDVIAGFFLLFEGLIAVGDAVSFGNSSGVVEEVGLRVTKYRTFSGELWVIPNGEIRAFGNSNRQWMRAIVPVGVAYEQDIGKAMHVLEAVGAAWAAEHRDTVLEPPQVQGILSFDESAVTLRLVVKVRSSQQGTAEWELRRRIKEAFDREGVEIALPRRVLYTRPETDGFSANGKDLGRPPKRTQILEEARSPDEGAAHTPSPSARELR
jgi:small conductance mechanosensitive channel